MYITTTKLKEVLNLSKESKIGDQSRILMIEVNEKMYRDQAENPTKYKEGIISNVLGTTPIVLAEFEFLVVWRLCDCWYQRSKGINTDVAKVVIEEVESPPDIHVVDEDGTLVNVGDLADLIKPYFINNHQQWKMEALLLPVSAQPSHFSKETPWRVNDITPVQKIKTRDLAALIEHEGMHYQGCYKLDEQIGKDAAIIQGYASYRIGSELSSGYLMLNWLIRISIGKEQTIRPDIAVIESDRSPGLVLAGMSLCDKNGNQFTQHQESLHLMRMLQDYREWTGGCLGIFSDFMKQYFSDNSEVQEWLAVSESLVTTTTDKSRQLELFSHTDANRTQTFIVENNDEPNLSFEGVRLGRVIDSSQQGFLRILDLYQTQEGNWVCVKKSMYEGQDAREEQVVKVLSSKQEVIKFFGSDQLAKSLYKQANIDHIRRID